jgi:hypothetical protein
MPKYQTANINTIVIYLLKDNLVDDVVKMIYNLYVVCKMILLKRYIIHDKYQKDRIMTGLANKWRKSKRFRCKVCDRIITERYCKQLKYMQLYHNHCMSFHYTCFDETFGYQDCFDIKDQLAIDWKSYKKIILENDSNVKNIDYERVLNALTWNNYYENNEYDNQDDNKDDE